MPPTEDFKLALAIWKKQILLVAELSRTLQGSLEFFQGNVNLINTEGVQSSMKIRQSRTKHTYHMK